MRYSRGSRSGIVSAAGNQVTLLSGNEFTADGSWSNTGIDINGLTYNIAAVTGPRTMILSTDVGIANGVDYYTTGTSSPGNPSAAFPPWSPIVTDNGQPISSDNPRFLSGHPLEILLAVLQNELGIGQAFGPTLVINTGGGSGTGVAGFGINSNWSFYKPGNDATLINPNSYIDVPGILALRDGQFSGEHMEFYLTSSESGKSWIEDQILKPLGLYWITRSNGQLALKSMKHPTAGQVVTPWGLNDHTILEIPTINRWPVINMINCDVPADDQGSARWPFCFVNQTSIAEYKSAYVHSLTSEGLRLGRGAGARLFLFANRVFNRHGFATPEYTIVCQFKNLVLELGDFISLTHPNLLDLKAGTTGVTSVLCEVVSREPDYATGKMTYKAIDTRFISVPSGAFQIAAAGAGIPNWAGASAPQRAQYMFASDSAGHNSDGSAGNQAA